MNKLRNVSLCAWMLAVVVTCAGAEPSLKPAEVFGDHMVLQCDMPAPVWGTAAPGANITVEFGGQKKNAKADEKGNWKLALDPLPASAEPRGMTITAVDSKSQTATKTLSDILVGEVWIAAGGINMQISMAEMQKWAHPKDKRFFWEIHKQLGPLYDADIAGATEGRLRLLSKGQPYLTAEQKAASKGWRVCSPETVLMESAVGYAFAREVLRDRNVPVGLITVVARGGRIEGWLPTEKNPHGQIQPPAPFAVRGVLWYQGELDVMSKKLPSDYAAKLQSLVQGWRQAWGRDDLPFGVVQLASFRYSIPYNRSELNTVERLPAFQDAQRRITALPHVGLATTTDVTDSTSSFTPVNKREIGRRLWLWAARECYGKKDVVAGGPVFKRLETRDGKAVLHFDHCGGGLTSRLGRGLHYFQVCGPDGVYWPAAAAIEGDTVVVSCPSVKQPVAVRYNWHQESPASLCNKEGLAASPFNTEEKVSDEPTMHVASLQKDSGILRQPIPEKQVVLTFDDASVTHLNFVAPLLKKYGFGATFFVCEMPLPKSWVGKNREDYYMTWPQIKQLHDLGFEIGSHTRTHAVLSELPRDQVVEELAYVEKKCAEHGIPRPVSFAYPNYGNDEQSVQILRERGYRWGRFGFDPYYDPRTSHPLLVPCTGVARNHPEQLRELITKAKDGKVLVLLFHGVPDKVYGGVTYSPENFEKCLQILKETGCTVMALRDLDKYVDAPRAMDMFQPLWRY